MNFRYVLAIILPAITLVAHSFFSSIDLNRTFPANSLQGDTLSPLRPQAKDHKGTTIISSAGVLSLSSGLDNDFLHTGSINRSGFLYIETKLSRFINDRYKKIPLNLAIVIDRSGSMQTGKKMEFAREAAKSIIDKLTPIDYVSIIIYDEVVNLIQPSILVTNKEVLKSRIDSITPRGSTNLWGGTEAGFIQVKKKYQPGFINRVLLISDGLANAGLINSNIIKTKVQQYKDMEGLTLSSFGVGLDYNEVLMTDMAEAGSGNYYFIDVPGNMAVLFDKELNGLMNVAAQNAELRITLPPGIKLKKMFATKYEQKGSVIIIKFRDLFSEDTKGVLLEFSMADALASPLKFITDLTYNDVTDGQQKKVSNDNFLKPSVAVDNYLTHFNKKVLEQKVLYVANERMEQAMLEADKGNYGKARSLIKANIEFINSNRSYVTSSIELKKMEVTNGEYFEDLKSIEFKSIESVKYFQKTKRADNYKIRNKKQ